MPLTLHKMQKLGSSAKIPEINSSIENLANVTIKGPSKDSRFGHSLKVLDFNGDGLEDLVVGAPSFGSNNLTYNGSVYVYYGLKDHVRLFSAHPDLTFIGQGKYYGIGWSLGILKGNLLVGAPFSSINNGEQNGAVFKLAANRTWYGNSYSLGSSEVLVNGDQNYSWFGYNINSDNSSTDELLIISAPTYKICSRHNCSFSKNDIQAVGKTFIYSFNGTLSLLASITGHQEFSHHGFMSAFWKINTNKKDDLLVLSSPGLGVNGSLYQQPMTMYQTGAVTIYNLTSLLLNSSNSRPISQFYGDRLFSRFGNTVMVQDINNDKILDLAVSASLRSEVILDEFQKVEEGQIFIFLSKNGQIPRGNITLNCTKGSEVVPCTSEVADLILTSGESQGRLGTTMSTLTTTDKTYLLSGSIHSNRGARLSGAVSIYEFSRELYTDLKQGVN